MPKALPGEFRRDVIAVTRQGEAPLRQIAKDFSISEACLHHWLKIADRDDGVDSADPRGSGDQPAEMREARKRIKLLEQEAEVMRRAVGYPSWNPSSIAPLSHAVCLAQLVMALACGNAGARYWD